MTDMSAFFSIRFDSPELIVWAACVGFNVAIIISFIFKGSVNKLIDGLFSANAVDEGSAVSLVELGLNRLLLRCLLRDGSTLRRVVLAKGGELITAKSPKGKDVVDYGASRFYLDMGSEKRIASMRKGVIKWWLIPLVAIVSVVMAYGIILILPYFL